MPPHNTQVSPVFGPLLSWRTGPALWSMALAVACYLILLSLHAGGAWLPARMLNGLELYVQVITIIGAIAFAVQALTMFGYIMLNDEFMRSLVFKRISLAALVTILSVTAWSLLADAGRAPAFEPLYLYLVFLLIHTALLPFMNADRP